MHLIEDQAKHFGVLVFEANLARQRFVHQILCAHSSGSQ